MRKKTLGIILNAFNVILVIMIVMLIIMIGKRGAKPIEEAQAQEQEQPTVVASDQTVTQVAEEPEAVPEEPEAEEESRVLYATPNVEDSLSVRAGDGTNFDKIGSAFPGETFKVLEVGGSWSKVDYRGQEGFMSNAYLKFFYEVTAADGSVSRESVDSSELTGTGN